jgi:hypothetical protein
LIACSITLCHNLGSLFGRSKGYRRKKRPRASRGNNRTAGPGKRAPRVGG